MKIIFLSNQLFDYPLKTNKWHVATRVADRGHSVLFVDPPIRFRKMVKQFFQGRWGIRRLLTGCYSYGVASFSPGRSLASAGATAKRGASAKHGSSRSFFSGVAAGHHVKLCNVTGAPQLQLRVAQFIARFFQRGLTADLSRNSAKEKPFGFLFFNPKGWGIGRAGKNRSALSPGINLKVFTPLTSAPSESPNLTSFNINRMKSQLPEFFQGDAILWVYNPAMIEYIDKIPHRLLIYDCVDDYPSMANYKRLGLSEEIAGREAKIAARADIGFATTKALKQKLSRYNNNVHYVGNAGDYSRFAQVSKTEIPIPNPSGLSALTRRVGELAGLGNLLPVTNIKHPHIGFTGAIDDYKVNLSLLVKIAKDHPKKSLVLVGPTGVADDQPDLRELKALENVYFIGQRPYEEMPAFFAGFDCYIIPYNLNDYTLKGCFPVKFLDALAAGLPTVVTNLPAYQDFADVCYIAKTDDEFSRAIQTALEEDSPEKVEARMRTARQNSWNNKVQKMLHIVSSTL